MDIQKNEELYNKLMSLVYYKVNEPIPSSTVIDIREELLSLAQQISCVNSYMSTHLIDLKNELFNEVAYQQFCLNPVIYGQTLEVVSFAKGQILSTNQTNSGNLCHLLHPDILRVSEKLYRDGNYAEAACNAFVEVNVRVKKIYQTLCPDDTNAPDGQALMNKVFADKDPVVDAADRSTQTGRDIHMGTRFLFAGATAALRNPKSHENITIAKDDAMRRLIFASMLMFRLDEIVETFDNVS